MNIDIAIFEDDVGLAEMLQEGMELKKYKVTNYYDLTDDSWKNSDIVLGDFRNTLVSFEVLHQECLKNDIPIIAISGAETGFEPQLLKPFTIVDLEELILRHIIFFSLSKKKSEEKFSLLKFFKKN